MGTRYKSRQKFWAFHAQGLIGALLVVVTEPCSQCLPGLLQRCESPHHLAGYKANEEMVNIRSLKSEIHDMIEEGERIAVRMTQSYDSSDGNPEVLQ